VRVGLVTRGTGRGASLAAYKSAFCRQRAVDRVWYGKNPRCVHFYTTATPHAG
jgi:hypothetical protein